MQQVRELSSEELKDMKRLATDMCANYDCKYGCLILNDKCYMSYGVAYTNTGMCKYFRKAVLPTNPQLEAVLSGENIDENMKQCAICGKTFYPSGRNRFCSDLCRTKSKRIQDRDSKRKQRKNPRGMSENSGY